MRVDVVIPLGPRVELLMVDSHGLHAEPAPEGFVRVPSQPARLKLGIDDVRICYTVPLLQMAFETGRTGADFVTTGCVAVPRLQGVVLGALVSFPIVFAAKKLLAAAKGTAIRLVVSLHVFSARLLDQLSAHWSSFNVPELTRPLKLLETLVARVTFD